MEKKDYLALADLLKFAIDEFVKRMTEETVPGGESETPPPPEEKKESVEENDSLEFLWAEGCKIWSVGVRDHLGRKIAVEVVCEPDIDYQGDSHRFTIYTTRDPDDVFDTKQLTDIKELIKKYEPQIDHWWAHLHPAKETNKDA